jgi:NAD(P)H-flavin reductase
VESLQCYKSLITLSETLRVFRLLLPIDKTKIELIFGNATEADIVCRKEIDELKAQHPDRFNVTYILSKPEPDSVWKGLKGRVDEALFAKVRVIVYYLDSTICFRS